MYRYNGLLTLTTNMQKCRGDAEETKEGGVRGEERRGVWSIKKDSCSGGISMAAAMIRAFIWSQEIREGKWSDEAKGGGRQVLRLCGHGSVNRSITWLHYSNRLCGE